MPLSSGRQPAQFGHWLAQHLPRYTVHDDHGDSLAEENVAAIHGFCGAEVSNVTRLGTGLSGHAGVYSPYGVAGQVEQPYWECTHSTIAEPRIREKGYTWTLPE